MAQKIIANAYLSISITEKMDERPKVESGVTLSSPKVDVHWRAQGVK